jgi:hypothetical protein
MKLKHILIAVCALWPADAFPAGDTFYTGNRLFRYCEQKSESCTGYIAGIVDTIMVTNVVMKPSMICITGNIELGQAVDIAMNYMRAHPEGRQHNAASMVFVALSKAFPCEK